VVVDRLTKAAVELGADVLCLQEIDRGQTRSGGVDQTAAVAEAIGAKWWRFEPAIVGEPGAKWRAACPDDDPASNEAGYGVGLVSMHPVDSWSVVRLAAAPVRAPVAVPGGRGRFIMLRDEPRVALVARLGGPFASTEVASTHLSFVPGWNGRQLWLLLATLADSANAVVAGDLNLPGAAVRAIAGAAGWRSLVRASTYPTDRPRLQIDHVLGRGQVRVRRGFASPKLDLSDHRALVVDVEIDGKHGDDERLLSVPEPTASPLAPTAESRRHVHPFEIDIDRLESDMATGVPLVDVRNPDEFEAERVPGAGLIPLGELGARVDEVPSTGLVHVICHSGGRSLRAVEFLRTQGIDAWSVAGGTKSWVESGRSVDSGPA